MAPSQLFIIIFPFLCGFASTVLGTPAAAPRYPAIFCFGDSISDTGNLLALTAASPLSNEGRPPYGDTYFGRPTGRFSDGRLIIDFIAEAFGLPFLPPYLSKGQSFRQGANFAVGGATALDAEFFHRNGLGLFRLVDDNSLSVQLGWFQKLKPYLCQTPEECREFFGKSLFVVGEIGENDYGYALLGKKSLEEIQSYVPSIVASIICTTEKLILEGARELVVPGNFPLGCAGIYLTLLPSPNADDYDSQTGCLGKLNSISTHHNAVLQQELGILRAKHPQAKIVYADYYAAVDPMIHDPSRYGYLGGALKACCGGGGPYNFNPLLPCGHLLSAVCERPQEYGSWDGLHLPEATYRRVAGGVLNGTYASPPL